MTINGVDFKSTVGGQEVRLKLKEETLDIERKCDAEYHLAYTELMQKGIMPRATLERYMQEKQIWTQDDEKKLRDLQSQIVKLQMQLEDSKTHDAGLTIAKAMGDLRGQCLRLVEVKANVLSNSCESLADQIRRDAYLAYATVYADTGKAVFKDYADFLRRASDNEQVVTDARQVMLQLASDSFNSSLTGLPEVNYVKSVEKQIVEDANKVVEKAAKDKTTGAAVAEPVVEAAKKVIKKKTKKE